MGSKTNYLENKEADHYYRGQTWTPPATIYFALFRATAGKSPRSTAVTVGQTTVPATSNGRMYRCSTAGTTGASEPTWGTTDGGTTTDGGAVWTEMTPDFEGNTANLTAVEVSGNNYSRASLASNMTNWSGTQGAGTTTTSSGSSSQISNNVAITFPVQSGDWGWIGAVGEYDTATVGNLLKYSVPAIPQFVGAGGAASSFPVNTYTPKLDD